MPYPTEPTAHAALAPMPDDDRAAEAAHDWFIEHDDRRTFVWPYIALSVGISIFVGLFWLAALVGVHFIIEIVRHRRLRIERPVLASLWEIKLDLGLLLLSIAMAIYMEVAFGILGLNAAARTGAGIARAGAKSGLLQRAVRTLFLTLDDIVRVIGAFFAARGIGRSVSRASQAMPELAVDVHKPWASRWSLGDHIAIALALFAILLLLASPWASGHDFAGALQIVIDEFRPFAD